MTLSAFTLSRTWTAVRQLTQIKSSLLEVFGAFELLFFPMALSFALSGDLFHSNNNWSMQ